MAKVKGYIRRKSMLYVTGVEYGDYTMNHVLGCAHGCKYPCYAFLMKKRFGKVSSYEEWLEPYLVENTLELLDVEIPKLKDKIISVQLCFSTDPFMYGYDEVGAMSMAAIRKLNEHGIKCTVLTKGLLPIELAEFSSENEYGITLISLTETFQKQMEPHAAPYKERLSALRALHDRGCRTWVSIEPYPTPNLVHQNLDKLLEAVSFVDRIIFGRTNYSRDVSSFPEHKDFYNRCARRVIEFCDEHGIAYHIKAGTMAELELVFISETWYNSSMKEVRAGRKPYPTDLTDSQWEEIEPLYSGMRNRKWSKRELTNAVLYIVKTGCQWRQLPHDFPPYQTVYSFFSRGAKSGLWEKILAHLVEKTRKDAGKSAEPHYALIDSQSVKTVADNEARGIDGGKKQKGANGMPS